MIPENMEVYFSGTWSNEEKEEILQKAIAVARKYLVGVLMFQDEKNVTPGNKKGYVFARRKTK